MNARVEVPDDFPPDEPTLFALTGSQLKFSLVEGVDGRFYQPGTEPGHRLARYRECLAEVVWCVDLLRLKLSKPKYRAMSRDALLARLRVNLIRDRLRSEAESDWILSRVSESFDKWRGTKAMNQRRPNTAQRRARRRRQAAKIAERRVSKPPGPYIWHVKRRLLPLIEAVLYEGGVDPRVRRVGVFARSRTTKC
jgi:hypothetical protein